MSSVLPEFITICQSVDPKTTWAELTQRQLYLPESVIMKHTQQPATVMAAVDTMVPVHILSKEAYMLSMQRDDTHELFLLDADVARRVLLARRVEPRKIYVGSWSASLERLTPVPPIHLHPADFEAYYKAMQTDGFTNNPTFLDHVDKTNVFVVRATGEAVPLLEMPEVKQIGSFQNEFTAGELWSFTNGKYQVSQEEES